MTFIHVLIICKNGWWQKIVCGLIRVVKEKEKFLSCVLLNGWRRRQGNMRMSMSKWEISNGITIFIFCPGYPLLWHLYQTHFNSFFWWLAGLLISVPYYVVIAYWVHFCYMDFGGFCNVLDSGIMEKVLIFYETCEVFKTLWVHELDFLFFSGKMTCQTLPISQHAMKNDSKERVLYFYAE